MFFNIIFNDIVPIFVVMALGYAGAKMNAFTPSQTQALNKVVLNFALPAALFVSITKATREMLFEDLTLTLVSLIGIVALFFVCYWVCRKVFHHTAAEAAVCGLTAGSPTIGFLGYIPCIHYSALHRHCGYPLRSQRRKAFDADDGLCSSAGFLRHHHRFSV